MKQDSFSPRLSKAAWILREQIDDAFPSRDRKSDGWIGDAKHRARKSDHNPDDQGWVRALDIDADLRHQVGSWELANQLRVAAKSDKRINYIIHKGRIASRRFFFRWRKYAGDSHEHHLHISFTKLGDTDMTRFDVPCLGGRND